MVKKGEYLIHTKIVYLKSPIRLMLMQLNGKKGGQILQKWQERGCGKKGEGGKKGGK